MTSTTIPIRHFYMIRHGETEANVKDVCAGQMDTPLTERGKSQAAAAQKIIEQLSVPPAAIFHSHLARARDTAAIINQNLQLPMHENPNISERDFGDWVGMPYADARALLDQGQEPPYGEVQQEFSQRVKNGFTEILEPNAGPVLIVCHGGVFRAFGGLFGITLRGVKNCQLYEFAPQTDAAAFPWKIVKHTAVE